jgi:DNA invertase Pin-like site-specific DNA recombinase
MPTAHQHKTKDQKEPQRAAIYLSDSVPNGEGEPRDETSIEEQLVLCRCAAMALELEIVDVFIDRGDLASRSGLHQAMKAVRTQRLDFLIVSSLERLADSYYDTVRVAWHLGKAGTIPLPAEVGVQFLPAKAA